jgi:outer membrane protein OmpA-like peptidoglycan-associated protein
LLRPGISVLLLAVLALAPVAKAVAADYFTTQEFIKILRPEKTRSLTPGTGEAATEPGTAGSGRVPDLKIVFPFGSAALTDLARERLDVLGQALVSDDLATLRFEVAGHTDAVGGEVYNQQLSEQRAAAVVDYLDGKFGIESSRLIGRGYGKTRPLAGVQPTDQLNRRVEISSFE